MTAAAPPLGVDELTAPWLAGALGAPVTDVEVLDAHSGTTGRVRLAVTYEGGATNGPASVFVKLAPFDERQRRFVDAVGLGVAEATFYRDVAASTPVRVPRVWHAAVDGGRYVMVLEDLEASGCRFPRPDDADVGELAGRIVDELAALHARFWGSEALRTGPLAFVRQGARLAFGGGGPFIARAVDRFAAEMPPVFTRLGELYVARAPEIASLFEVEPRTLAHGDPHLGNLFVDGHRPGFFDWGMVMARAGMWDVAYVLCGSVPTEVRRAHEQAWIRRYRDGLAAGGVALDAATAWDQYRLFAVYAWASATSTAGVGERWQSAAVGRGGMARATAAVDDLDAVAYLERRLTAARP
ncbi:MAG TPA: phosphotransferase [Acidimicrobiia bacterium]|nr:phosphotransferase [Acidimicrobiia bacterium]